MDNSAAAINDTPEVDVLADYRQWNLTCADEMFDSDHIACMKDVALKLDVIFRKVVERKAAGMSDDKQAVFRESILGKEKNIETVCWEKMVEFGPGTLNKRRLPLCLNDGKVALTKLMLKS